MSPNEQLLWNQKWNYWLSFDAIECDQMRSGDDCDPVDNPLKYE